MSYGTPPPPPPSGYSAPFPAGPPANHPKAVLILVFGILGLICCGPLGIAAWIMGTGTLKEIDRSPGTYGGRGMVKAGQICGIIATVLWVILVAVYAALAITADN